MQFLKNIYGDVEKWPMRIAEVFLGKLDLFSFIATYSRNFIDAQSFVLRSIPTSARVVLFVCQRDVLRYIKHSLNYVKKMTRECLLLYILEKVISSIIWTASSEGRQKAPSCLVSILSRLTRNFLQRSMVTIQNPCCVISCKQKTPRSLGSKIIVPIDYADSTCAEY